jgi:hypothetical protein
VLRGLGSADIDPAETLLRLLSTAVARAQMYAAELERMVSEHGVHATVVGKAVVVDAEGGTHEVRGVRPRLDGTRGAGASDGCGCGD